MKVQIFIALASFFLACSFVQATSIKDYPGVIKATNGTGNFTAVVWGFQYSPKFDILFVNTLASYIYRVNASTLAVIDVHHVDQASTPKNYRGVGISLDDARDRLYLVYGLTSNIPTALGNIIVATNNMTVVSAAGIPTWNGVWPDFYGGFYYDNVTRTCFWASYVTLNQNWVTEDYWNPFNTYYWNYQYSVTGLHWIFDSPRLNTLNLDSSGEVGNSGYLGNAWYYYYFNCNNITAVNDIQSFTINEEIKLYNYNPIPNVPPFNAPITNNNSEFYAWKWGGYHTANYMYTPMYSIRTKSHGSIIVQWQLPLQNLSYADYYSAKTELVFGSELHFQTIWVDEVYGVIFIGTGDGYIKKFTYTDDGVNPMNVSYPSYNGLQNLDNTTTQNITYQYFDVPNKRAFYSTLQTVYSIPMYNCALGNTNCSTCAALKEPYCRWCNSTSSCTDAGTCTVGSWANTC